MREQNKESRKAAESFIQASFEAIKAEPKMLEMLKICNKVKENGNIPNDMDLCDTLKKSLADNAARRNMLEIILSDMTKEEMKVINGFYRDGLCAEDIVEDVCVERSEVYRIKNRALDKAGKIMGM